MGGSHASDLPQSPVAPRRAGGPGLRALRWIVERHGAALALLALGLGAIVARGPLPSDETRYIEVAREFEPGRPLTLQLNGVPYAHKPPLAFWLAELLHALGLEIELTLRLIPLLASAATCVLVARLGRRLGVRHADWVFASLLLPLGYAQVLLLDPLLVFAVWLALDAWWHGRDALTVVGAALAFLAKGPVAVLFLLPLGFALTPLRPRTRARAAGLTDAVFGSAALVWLLGAAPRLQHLLGADARTPVTLAWSLLATCAAACAVAATGTRPAAAARLLADVSLGALALAAWAFEASLRGGATFARDLLVHQTRDRMAESFAHSQPFWFYAPILLVGLLPAVPALAFARPTGLLRRVAWAVALALLALSFVDQKQPHYLLPLVPTFALLLAQAFEASARVRALWEVSASWVLGVLLAAVVLGWPLMALLAPSRYGDYALDLAANPAAWLAWSLAVSAGSFCLAQVLRRGAPLRSSAAALVLGIAVLALPVHRALDLLTTPRGLMSALREVPTVPLATYRCFQGGYFNWLGARDRVTRLEGPEDLRTWCTQHPGGLLVSFDEGGADLADQGLVGVANDRYRGRGVGLYRVDAHTSTSP